MYEFYNYLDEIIIKYDVDKLLDLQNKLKSTLSNKALESIINREEIIQLQMLVDGIVAYNKDDFEQAQGYLVDALQLTNPNFSMDHFKRQKYNLLESRIVLVLALALRGQDQLTLLINMMLMIYNQLNHSEYLTDHHIELIIKLLMNISYNYYNINNIQKSFEYANMGIEFCEKHFSSYYLFLLY